MIQAIVQTRRSKLLILCGHVLGALMLSGCVYAPNLQQGKIFETSPQEKIAFGMKSQQVLRALGSPNDAHTLQESTQWFYWYQIEAPLETELRSEDLRHYYAPTHRMRIVFDQGVVQSVSIAPTTKPKMKRQTLWIYSKTPSIELLKLNKEMVYIPSK